MVTKEALIEGMRTRLDEANLEIAGLIARENQIAALAYADYTRHVNALQQRCAALHCAMEKFQCCREDAEDADVLQSGLGMAWEMLSQTLDSARAQFH